MTSNIQIEKPRAGFTRAGLLITMLILVIGSAVIGYYTLLRDAKTVEPLMVSNFIGQPEVYSREKRAWVPLNRGDMLNAKDKIRTGPNTEVDLRIPDQINFRLKENSELENKAPGIFDEDVAQRLELLKGKLLGSTQEGFEDQKGRFEIATPVLVASIRGTTFMISADPETLESWVGVLRGQVEVRSKSIFIPGIVTVESLETTMEEGGKLTAPQRISRLQWDQMKEAYELTQKSLDYEANQIDLSRQAGNLFQDYAFDHGTFYMPKVGFADREFFFDSEENAVILKIDYDVFPESSFVGMYIKVRNMNLENFDGLEFYLRRESDKDYPAAFKIEIKEKGQVVRAFAPHTFKKQWKTVYFPFQVSSDTPVSEITFVFSNERVGEYKKGILEFRDFNLIPSKSTEGESKPKETDAAPEKAQMISIRQPQETPKPAVRTRPKEAIRKISLKEPFGKEAPDEAALAAQA